MAIGLLALISALAFVGVGSAVGGKLLWLALRTRALPELFVGGSMLVLAGVAWPALLLVNVTNALPDAAVRVAWCVAAVAMSAGWSGVYLFTWHVFRPGPGWGRTLALLGIGVECAAGLAGVVRGLTLADVALLRAPTPSGLVLVLGAQAVYVWTAIEAILYRAMLMRRIPLGLADPLVADRFGLWAWTSAFGFASLAPAVLAQLAGGDPNSAANRLLVGVCGVLCSAALWFAFMPPAAYARWVRAKAPRVEPAGGF